MHRIPRRYRILIVSAVAATMLFFTLGPPTGRTLSQATARFLWTHPAAESIVRPVFKLLGRESEFTGWLWVSNLACYEGEPFTPIDEPLEFELD